MDRPRTTHPNQAPVRTCPTTRTDREQAVRLPGQPAHTTATEGASWRSLERTTTTERSRGSRRSTLRRRPGWSASAFRTTPSRAAVSRGSGRSPRPRMAALAAARSISLKELPSVERRSRALSDIVVTYDRLGRRSDCIRTLLQAERCTPRKPKPARRRRRSSPPCWSLAPRRRNCAPLPHAVESSRDSGPAAGGRRGSRRGPGGGRPRRRRRGSGLWLWLGQGTARLRPARFRGRRSARPRRL